MWLEIFRTGTHTDSSGKEATYTAEDLLQIAEHYNNRVQSDSKSEAPLVKGHPKSDDPAYGWIERLATRGDRLIAKVRAVSSEIFEDLKSGRYRNVSIALYPDKTLRHVGLLGAVAPAVKGLNFLGFSEGEFANFVNEFSLFDDADDEQGNSKAQSNAETEKIIAENKALKEKISCLEQTNKELETKISEMNKQNRQRAFKEFAEKTLKSINGSMFSAHQTAELRTLLEETAELEEKINKEVSSMDYSLTNRIKSFVLSLKPILLGKEIATKQETEESSSNFSYKNTIPERLRLHELAKEIQVENPNISYEEAIIIANKSNFTY